MFPDTNTDLKRIWPDGILASTRDIKTILRQLGKHTLSASMNSVSDNSEKIRLHFLCAESFKGVFVTSTTTIITCNCYWQTRKVNFCGRMKTKLFSDKKVIINWISNQGRNYQNYNDLLGFKWIRMDSNGFKWKKTVRQTQTWI